MLMRINRGRPSLEIHNLEIRGPRVSKKRFMFALKIMN
jgi:hypothetical protein